MSSPGPLDAELSPLAEQINSLSHCLLVIRHGQTEMNKLNVATTRTETPLTPAGIEQAQRLARSLQGVVFDHAYSSPLARARETLEIALGEGHGLDLVTDVRLLEPDAGPFEGENFDELDKPSHPLHELWLAYHDEEDPVAPEGAADPLKAAQGAVEFVQMCASVPGRHIASSHGHLVRLMAAGFLGVPIGRADWLKLGNCRGALWQFWDTPPYRHQLAGWNLG